MQVHAFAGTRYAAAAGNAGALAGPPFDQIGDRLRDRFHGVPFHIAHLTRPRAPGEGDAHQHAATLHQEWLEGGVLERDARPALYPYEIRLPGGGRRLGLTALVAVEPAGSGVIRPHERTLARALEDRLGLLRATQVDLEPILLLADDGGTLDQLLSEDVGGTPLVVHRDASGCSHLLFRLDDARRIRAYRELLRPVAGLIADGHHRYQVASTYAAQVSAVPGTAASCKLAVVTSLSSPALAIDPIHRALEILPDPQAAEPAIAQRIPWAGSSGGGFAEAVARAPGPALGFWAGARRPEIWRLDDDAAPSVSREAAALPVVLLHHAVLPRLGLAESSAADGTITYRSDPEELLADVEQGRFAAGFWLPPMAPEAFAAAIADGSLLPPKSTRFLPKVASGLVWTPHDSPLA